MDANLPAVRALLAAGASTKPRDNVKTMQLTLKLLLLCCAVWAAPLKTFTDICSYLVNIERKNHSNVRCRKGKPGAH